MPFSWNDDALPINPLSFLEQQVGAGLYWLDLAANRMTWSDGMYRVLNLARGEVEPSRMAIRERVHPEDRRPIDEMDRLFSSGRPFQLEFRIIMHDRRLRWISDQVEFLMDPSGKPSAAIGILRNMDGIHRSTELTEDYSQRLIAVLKLSNLVAWTTTPDGELTSVSNWKAGFLALDEPIGSKMIVLVHPEEREATGNDWRTAMEQGGRFSRDHRMRLADGSYRWFRCSAIPIKSNDGSIREWIGATFDIHDEKTGGALRLGNATVTGAQIRGARSILRLSVRDLSNLTGISIGTIRRLEEVDGISTDDQATGNLLRAEMEKRGVAFIFPAGVKPAVCPA